MRRLSRFSSILPAATDDDERTVCAMALGRGAKMDLIGVFVMAILAR
jgi:hypothetical protein